VIQRKVAETITDRAGVGSVRIKIIWLRVAPNFIRKAPENALFVGYFLVNTSGENVAGEF